MTPERQDVADIVTRLYVLQAVTTPKDADKALAVLKSRLGALGLAGDELADQVALAVETATELTSTLR